MNRRNESGWGKKVCHWITVFNLFSVSYSYIDVISRRRFFYQLSRLNFLLVLFIQFHIRCVRYISSLFWIIIIAFIPLLYCCIVWYLLSCLHVFASPVIVNFAFVRWARLRFQHKQKRNHLPPQKKWEEEKERARKSRLAFILTYSSNKNKGPLSLSDVWNGVIEFRNWEW